MERERQRQQLQAEMSRHLNESENQSQPKTTTPYRTEFEEKLNAEKAMKIIETIQKQQSSAEQSAKRMNALKEKYIELEVEKNPLIAQHNDDKYKIPPLEYRLELIEEHAKNIETLQTRAEQLRETRQNVRLLEFKKKKDIDEKLSQAMQELGQAQDFFKNRFNVDPSQAYEEMKRSQEEIRIKKDALTVKRVRVQIIRDKQATLELEYHTKKLLNEIRPDYEQKQIDVLLEQMHQPPQSVREQQIRARVERRLETITDYSFEKAIENLPSYQAHLLTTMREQAKERKQLLKFEREQAFLTRYYQTQDKDERKRLLRVENERRNQTHELSR